MKKNSQIGFLFILIIILNACGTSPKDYLNTEPEFDLKEFFSGELKGWGLVKDYRGKVTKRFTVEMKGSWVGDKGELYELFKYQDGTEQVRIWYLEKNKNGVNVGKADDVVGLATGEQKGFAFNWNYDLLLTSDNKSLKVHLNDWLYQIDSEALISEAKIKKFGVDVGEVIVFILKQGNEL